MKRRILFTLFIFCLTTSQGQVWKPYGAGFIPPNVIYDLLIYNNELYACGE
ncbi:MAG: hypothetical protein IPP71_01850 [Bacteroidetes bacterium]|nr:hypothetical protein [Bacteroidota bacterium]